MNWWQMETKEAARRLETDEKQGLTSQMAAERLVQKGRNELAETDGKKSLFWRFLAQFDDFMILLLLGAAVVSVVISRLSGENDVLDAVMILGIVVLNAALGLFQESKAEKALEALKKMAAPHARVIRDGIVREIPAAEVVPGDLLLLETGDAVCADGRVVESRSLKTEESALTGEALPVEKTSVGGLPEETATGDRKNMVLAGGYVVYGKGKVLVTATGMDTEMGRIAAMLSHTSDSMTPLQKKLEQTGKQLGIGALAICALIFCMGILQEKPPFSMFMTAVSLAVAAIPEGLPAIVTIVLAMGTSRMSEKHTIVRRLSAVETLGGAQVICSDKTGTLTQNRMQVTTWTDYSHREPKNEDLRETVANLFALCNDCNVSDGNLQGEPTEKALGEYAQSMGIDFAALRRDMPRVGEIPFSSARKRMTTLHKTEDGWISVTKGAPDILLEKCAFCMEGSGQVPFDSRRKSMARMVNGEMAAQALRVVAVAFRQWSEKPPLTEEALERNLVFAGMAGMVDPPRPEVKEAVHLCRQAGIRPVMITGDHVLTAEAIGRELGIYQKGDCAVTGAELDKMSDKELETAAETCTVFARVAPEHKVRIVQAFQKRGNVVAMTGDGVNDAPALKTADIGCAMGKSGTEVAKGASDLILTDDNFATIVEAVREGRGIYDNIRKAVHFLLSSNIGEILTIFVAMVLGWAAPLLPIQLLWVNLVTDSLPAIALGMEPAEENIMERPPRKNTGSLFGDGLGGRILLEGVMIGVLALLAFGIGHVYFDQEDGYAVGRTMAFAVLSLSQLVHAFNMRGEGSLGKLPFCSNKWLLMAFVVGATLQCVVIMMPPLAGIFQVVPLNGEQWLLTAALALAPLPLVELEKAIWHPKQK
ncbi:calcium-translocating P-type ATPase, PMCA-type [Anaerotignum lactatifermentans]|uniref:calcium-translocating P-type ATPase, PMCA-type n=1 Tax=Anaerotignum lactatifermentans TaxID=160404 RepID=UPI00174D9A65|nr:calcium-translocating P-type ATPase, PMCA-type [Anaerotignum lactatifermentans]HJE93940.1 calcium-translocating P-type ATPase, PMCA-type [Anaerotignum lactatifermentans]